MSGLVRLVATLGVRAGLVAAGFLLASTSASAQSVDAPSINLRGFAPAPDPRATLFLEPVATPGPGVFHGAGWVSYAYRPLVLRDAEGELVGKAVEHQIVYDQTLGVGVGSRLGLGLTMPVILYQKSEDIGPVRSLFGGALPPSPATGDLMLSAKFAIVPPGEMGGFGLGVVGRLTVPTGARQGTLGEGAVTGETRLLAEMGLAAFTLQGSAGVKVRPIDRSFGGNTWGEEIPWGAGLLVKPQIFGVDAKGRWTLGAEAHGALPLAPSSPFTNVTVTPAYAGGTLRFAPGALHFLFGAEAALTRAAGAPPLRAVLSIGYAPRNNDKDHDGVPDDVDDCPGLAEDRDGFQDSDGCPELDNDDDGVLDADDKCPNEKEDLDGDRDTDGCPDPDPPKPKETTPPKKGDDAGKPKKGEAPTSPAAPDAVAPTDAPSTDASPKKPAGKGKPKGKKKR